MNDDLVHNVMLFHHNKLFGYEIMISTERLTNKISIILLLPPSPSCINFDLLRWMSFKFEVSFFSSSCSNLMYHIVIGLYKESRLCVTIIVGNPSSSDDCKRFAFKRKLCYFFLMSFLVI